MLVPKRKWWKRTITARVSSETIAAMIARISVASLPDDASVVYFPVSRALIKDLTKDANVPPRGFQIRDIQCLLKPYDNIDDIMLVDYMTRLVFYTVEPAPPPPLPSARRMIWDVVKRIAQVMRWLR